MTIFIPPTEPRRAGGTRPGNGFTLVEVMIGVTLSTLVLAGVLSAFLLIGRTAYRSSNYSELEAQTRRSLQIFGNDVRESSNIHWNSAQSITLSVVTAGNISTQVTYAYDASTSGATAGCFYRVAGDATSTAAPQILMRNVGADFMFQRFKLEQSGVTDNAATSDLETKLLQVSFRATRSGVTTVDASQATLSARYILRNKIVSN